MSWFQIIIVVSASICVVSIGFSLYYEIQRSIILKMLDSISDLQVRLWKLEKKDIKPPTQPDKARCTCAAPNSWVEAERNIIKNQEDQDCPIHGDKDD